MTCVALDAFALLAMLLGEPVADKVKAALSGADPGGQRLTGGRLIADFSDLR